MKVDFKNSVNQSEITSVRSQIKDSGDLKKFDNFLAKHDSFDLDNDDHVNALRKNGDKTGDVSISVTIDMN